MKLQYQGESIAYSLLRSRRKTVAISIGTDLKILVKAPLQASAEEIQSIVEKKAGWILKKREELANCQEKKESRELTEGKWLLFQGEAYALRIAAKEQNRQRESDSSVEISGRTIIVYAKKEIETEVRRNLLEWYYEMARQWICRRTAYYNRELQEPINRICIKDQKSRWGSCSSKRNLNFNWRIIMAPPEVADYVVVHEMCHLRHLNHSSEFWAEVAGILPDYKVRRQWLRAHGGSLMEII